ncbi:TonB-dependent siderophore receptor [uncultured Hyphomonas sp.]|uniref:TonB-dependent siderophore receptor n=1 Tax=uncultured Hyphomonas sp. TaxID=225298 RepID=UPI002AAC0561|nr:TonB-dependent siderophore receptor [uncultured Hyphomonas sp.]
MKRVLFAGVCSAAIWSGAAFAQTPAPQEDAERVEDTVVVVATGLSSATSTTKTDSPIIESPQSISVISREEIDLRAVSTIADALSYSAGVQAEPSGIDSRTDEISVRGFGAGGFSSNNNFVDGLRLPAGGQWTRFGFDPYGLQQIEVLKGPSSVLYGQAAPGGIVNIVSKRPTEAKQFNAQLQATGYTDLENWTWQAAADGSGALTDDGTLLGRLVGLVRYGDTAIDDVENGRYYISPSLTWAPTDDTRWTFLGQYQRDEGGATFQFLPAVGSHESTNGGYIENDANIGEPDWNAFDRDQLLLASFFEHDFSDKLTIRNNVRYTHVETLYRVGVLAGGTVTDCSVFTDPTENAACIPGQTIRRRAVQGDGESDGFAIDTQLQYKFATGELEHTLLGGIDYFHTEWEHFRDLVSLPGQPRGQVDPLWDIFNPVPRGSGTYFENLNPQIYGSAVSKQTGLYIQDQASLGNWRFTLGGRQDWSEDESTNLLNDYQYDTDADKFTWRAGAVYLFDNGFAPYVSYSESFLPQVVDPSSTLGGVLFEPTTGQQFEAGVRYQGGRNIYVTLGAYDIIQENVSTSDPDGTLCGTRVCQIQTGEAEVKGLEFEGRASLDTGTTFILSASTQDAEVTKSNDGIEGNTLAQVPEVLASFFINQEVESGTFKGAGFGGGVRYTGESFGDSNNVFEIEDYTLFDLFVRYDLGALGPAAEGVDISLNVRNVANERYVTTCSSVASCFYGQGRVVTARLQYRW